MLHTYSCNVSIFFLCMLFHVTTFRWHFVNIVYSVSELWPVWQWLAWSQFTWSKPERCSIWTNVNTSSYVTDNSLVALLGNQEHLVEESILYILCKKCIVSTIIFSTELLPVSFQNLIISHWWIHEFLDFRDFWQWCETGIETILWDFLHRYLFFMKTTTFCKWVCFLLEMDMIPWNCIWLGL